MSWRARLGCCCCDVLENEDCVYSVRLGLRNSNDGGEAARA